MLDLLDRLEYFAWLTGMERKAKRQAAQPFMLPCVLPENRSRKQWKKDVRESKLKKIFLKVEDLAKRFYLKEGKLISVYNYAGTVMHKEINNQMVNFKGKRYNTSHIIDLLNQPS